MANKKKLNKYGWRPDTPDHRDYKWSAPKGLVENIPSMVDLRPQMPPVYDQGELGSCHDDRTEVLTNGGWKLFSELSADDLLASVDPVTKNLIFEKPSRLIRFAYSGDMHYGKSRSHDFAVTPDHKMLVRKWNEQKRTLNDEYELVPMESIGWYVGLLNQVNYEGVVDGDVKYVLKGVDHKHRPQRSDKHVDIDYWLMFLGIYLAEGTMLKQSEREMYKIQIAASKDREKSFVRQVLANLDIHATELEDRFTISNGRLYAALAALGLKGIKAPEKFVPNFVFALPSTQIKSFLLGHFMGDGCEQKGHRSHYTSSKKLADDLQALILLSGGWGSLSKRNPRKNRMKDGRSVVGKHPEYRVSQWYCKPLSLDKKEYVEVREYNGEVFCAEMPTYHTMVTRRNGKMLISGNCTANAVGADIQYAQIRQNKENWVPSRLFIYYNERVLENSIREDAGASLRSGIKSVVRWGFCRETTWAYNIPSFAKKPLVQAYREAVPNRVQQYARINQNLNDMRACLAGGDPFFFGFSVYSSFESQEVARTGNMPMPGRFERMMGGHAVLAVGYDDARRVFIIRNSWGEQWGDKGYFYMPFDFILNSDYADDFWSVSYVP